MEEQTQTLYTGAKPTSQRINFYLIMQQQEPQEVSHRFDLATEILTLLDEENKEAEYENFNNKFLKYQKKVNECSQTIQQAPKKYRSGFVGEIVNLNYNFDIVCRKLLQKYDFLMMDKKGVNKLILNVEGVLE